MSQLIDSFGRAHRDLRVSVTDRCGLRCAYCMPPEGVPWLSRESLLTADEILRVVRVAVDRGIEKVRLTGGEPLGRPDFVEIVRRIAALPSPPELACTTNGVLLARLARPLAEAGLERVNVSLDTTDREAYRQVTRRDRLGDVLAGLDAAREAGLRPIKINAVLTAAMGANDAESLLEFALTRGFELRFIEQMPLDHGRCWTREAVVPVEQVMSWLARRHELTPLGGRGSAPAESWLVDSGPGKVGFISAVTRPFCGDCDRLRLTADGALRSCLFATSEVDLRGPLRRGASDDDLAELLQICVSGKWAGHGISTPEFVQPARPMSAIGG